MTITAKERGEQVKAAFAAFLKEWDLEMNVETSDSGWNGTSVDGVEFSWNAVYDDKHDTVIEYGYINVGSYATKDCV